MNYSKLLNNYNSLPISINRNLLNLGKNEINKILPDDINSLLTSIGLKAYVQKLVYINVTKDGLFFNYDELKKELSKYFGITIDKHFQESIDGFKNRLNSKTGLATLPNNIRQECEKYTNHVVFSKYSEIKQHPTVTEKEEKDIAIATEKMNAEKFYKKFIEKKIDLFEKLVLNEEDYKKVTIDFDQDKLNLYLAFIVKEYAEKFKNKNKIKDYRFALKYINDYLDNNKELLDNNYEVLKYFPVDETFNINSLKEYMDSISICDLEDKSISLDKSTKKTYSKK